MGNLHSGRKPCPKARGLTARHLAIDIRKWHRQQLLKPGNAFRFTWKNNGAWPVTVNVRVNPDHLLLYDLFLANYAVWASQDFRIDLSRSDCHLGGSRPWFLCPTPDCKRQAALLYLDGTFACRTCLKLAYPSQRESEASRALSQLNKVKRRLGWPPGLLSECGDRPWGMHQRTFDRLKALHDIKCLKAFSAWSERPTTLHGHAEKLKFHVKPG